MRRNDFIFFYIINEKNIFSFLLSFKYFVYQKIFVEKSSSRYYIFFVKPIEFLYLCPWRPFDSKVSSVWKISNFHIEKA